MSDDDTLNAIREAVRAVCSRFDDDYWSACDQEHRFPSEFYAAMAEGGWIGIAIPERYGGGGQGIREAADGARGGRRVRRLHERRVGAAPVGVRHAPGGRPRQRGDEAAVPARRRRRHAARRVRRHRARRRDRHDAHHHPGRPRRRPLRHQRAQGVDVEGAGGRPHPAADPHDAARAVREADPGDDAVPRRPPRRRRRCPGDPEDGPQRRRLVRDHLRRRARAAERPRRRGGPRLPVPARRPQRRAHPDRRRGARHRPRRRCGGPSPTPTSASCSTARSARTRASPSRSPRPTPSCAPPT